MCNVLIVLAISDDLSAVIFQNILICLLPDTDFRNSFCHPGFTTFSTSAGPLGTGRLNLAELGLGRFSSDKNAILSLGSA